MSERTITSQDGTHIVYERHGSGPPLVMVHGGLVDRTFWGPSLPLLAQQFTVYAMDRRGHGHSASYRADHALEREYEDVLTLIAEVGAPVAVLGHSSGALVALHAARRTPYVRQLVLYEPPRFEGVTAAVRARLHASLADGDLDSIVATFLIDIVEATTNPNLPPEARAQMLAGMRQTPIWPAALRNAHSIPAEVDSYATYRFDPAEFRDFTTATVLLLGSASSPVVQRWAKELQAALPHSGMMMLEGQGHSAHWAAPELFARTVKEAVDWTPSR
jgi:pimeloyl-ACP methyl ester carboxylesterase